MKPVFIEAITLDDAWHQAVYNLFEHGRRYTIDQGSYAGSERIEFDFVVIQIKAPWEEPTTSIPRSSLTLTWGGGYFALQGKKTMKKISEP